jgi:hypothetical protein
MLESADADHRLSPGLRTPRVRAGAWLGTLVLVLVFPLAVSAQGMLILNPMPPSYDLGGFSLSSPPVDNWRETQSSATSFQGVYAERASDVDINQRCHFLAESHKVDDPDYQGDSASAATAAWIQHTELRGEALVAFTRVQVLEEAPGIFTFSLVVKVGEENVQETFFIMLAPDKSEYFVAKLTTKEPQFREAPFYAPLMLSLSTLHWRVQQADGDSLAGKTTEDAVDGESGGEAPAVQP